MRDTSPGVTLPVVLWTVLEQADPIVVYHAEV